MSIKYGIEDGACNRGKQIKERSIEYGWVVVAKKENKTKLKNKKVGIEEHDEAARKHADSEEEWSEFEELTLSKIFLAESRWPWIFFT